MKCQRMCQVIGTYTREDQAILAEKIAKKECADAMANLKRPYDLSEVKMIMKDACDAAISGTTNKVIVSYGVNQTRNVEDKYLSYLSRDAKWGVRVNSKNDRLNIFYIGRFREKEHAREARDLVVSMVYGDGNNPGKEIEKERMAEARAIVATKYKLRTKPRSNTEKSKAKVTTDVYVNNKNIKAEIIEALKSKEGGMTENGIMEEVRTNYGSGFNYKVFVEKMEVMVSERVLIKEGDVIKIGDTKKKAANDRSERAKRRRSGLAASKPPKPVEKKVKKRRSSMYEEEEEEEAAPDPPLSEYELYRLEKIKRNQAKLRQLGL